jgi:4-cresol dehydrogenase (hydroxylating) flavoprotein subunit
MEGNRAWHTYKRGLGPVLDPLFMQSNLGIVTRMGIWLQRRPACYLPAAFKLWRDEDIDRGLEIVRDLMMDGVMDGVPNIFNTLISASVLATRSDWSTDPAPLDDGLIDRIAHDLDVGRWAGRFALYGDEDMVDLKLAKIRKAFSVIPGAEVVAERKFLRGEFDQITRSSDKIQFGIPDLEVDNITGWYNQAEGGHIGFSPVVPLKAENIREVRTMLRTHLEQEAGLDFLVGLLTINERSVIMVTMVLFDTTDPEMTTRAYDACRGLVAEAGRRGYGEYRAHLSFMDLAQEQYGFGDHAYRRFCETIKDAVDPNGILSPGRHGIWPSAMRP